MSTAVAIEVIVSAIHELCLPVKHGMIVSGRVETKTISAMSSTIAGVTCSVQSSVKPKSVRSKSPSACVNPLRVKLNLKLVEKFRLGKLTPNRKPAQERFYC